MTEWRYIRTGGQYSISDDVRHGFYGLVPVRFQMPGCVEDSDLDPGEPGYVRVGNAFRYDDASEFEFTGENAIWYEADLYRAEPVRETDSIGIGFDGPVFEFRVPADIPDRFRQAHADGVDAHDGFESNLSRHARDSLVETLQENMERENYRANRLDPRDGKPVGLPAEVDPEESRHSRETLYESSRSRRGGLRTGWQEAVGGLYYEFKRARMLVNERHESMLEAYDLVAFDVLDVEGESQCPQCGAVRADEKFLDVLPYIEAEDSRRRRRCKRCAERDFPDEVVTEAYNYRARQHGGQTKLTSTNSGGSGNGGDAE